MGLALSLGLQSMVQSAHRVQVQYRAHIRVQGAGYGVHARQVTPLIPASEFEIHAMKSACHVEFEEGGGKNPNAF